MSGGQIEIQDAQINVSKSSRNGEKAQYQKIQPQKAKQRSSKNLCSFKPLHEEVKEVSS